MGEAFARTHAKPSDEPSIRQEPADCGSQGCVTPRPAPQRAEAKPIIVADRAGNGSTAKASAASSRW